MNNAGCRAMVMTALAATLLLMMMIMMMWCDVLQRRLCSQQLHLDVETI
jgi:hypothetical protein